MPEDAPKPDEFGWLRVTDRDTGHKYSIRPSQLPHGNYTVLKQDASDPLTGEPLPHEYAEADSSQGATAKKES